MLKIRSVKIRSLKDAGCEVIVGDKIQELQIMETGELAKLLE